MGIQDIYQGVHAQELLKLLPHYIFGALLAFRDKQ